MNLECISNFTEGCQPVQRMTLYTMLHLVATLSSCDPGALASVPEPSDFELCLHQFTVSFTGALRNSMDASVSVDGFVACVLSSWDVESLVGQPPAYKVYWTQTLTFLLKILLPAVRREAPAHTG